MNHILKNIKTGTAMALTGLLLNTNSLNAQRKTELVYDPSLPPPTVLYESILSNVEFNSLGHISVSGINTLFLPAKDKKGKDVKYEVFSGNDKDARIFVSFTRDGAPFGRKLGLSADGNEVQKILTIAAEADLVRNPLPKFEEGKYQMELFLDDKKFYQFDFSVVKKMNNDVYSKIKELYFAHGPWEEYGFFTFTQDEENFVWNMYAQTENMEIKKDEDDYYKASFKIELYKDGKLYGKSYKGKADDINVYRHWDVYTATLRQVTNEDNYITKNDITDGKYQVKVSMNDVPFVYPFEVKDGKIQLDPRQDRSKNPDPLTLIEGKNNKFWVKNTSGKSTIIPCSWKDPNEKPKDGPFVIKGNNGVVSESGVYKDGKKNGVFKTYLNSGKLDTETTYVNDMKNGPDKTYNSDGTIYEMFTYKDNELEGPYIKNTSSGKKVEEGQYKDGKKEGTWKIYGIKGNLEKTEKYAEGILVQ